LKKLTRKLEKASKSKDKIIKQQQEVIDISWEILKMNKQKIINNFKQTKIETNIKKRLQIS
jgi:hypothetical protein